MLVREASRRRRSSLIAALPRHAGRLAAWRCRRRRAGITLFESLLATAILSFAVVAIVQTVVTGQMQTHESLRIERAMTLAQAMMEEVTARPVRLTDDADGLVGSLRNPGQLMTVLDYNGLTEATGELQDAAGQPLPAIFATFSRTVSVQAHTLQGMGLVGDMPGVRVTVTVRSTQGGEWTLTRFVPEPAP